MTGITRAGGSRYRRGSGAPIPQVIAAASAPAYVEKDASLSTIVSETVSTLRPSVSVAGTARRGHRFRGGAPQPSASASSVASFSSDLQFLEIDNYAAKALHDTMLAEKAQYLEELSTDLPSDTLIESAVPYPNANLRIQTKNLGDRPGREMRDSRYDRHCQLQGSSSSSPWASEEVAYLSAKVHTLKEELHALEESRKQIEEEQALRWHALEERRKQIDQEQALRLQEQTLWFQKMQEQILWFQKMQMQLEQEVQQKVQQMFAELKQQLFTQQHQHKQMFGQQQQQIQHEFVPTTEPLQGHTDLGSD